MLTQLFVLQNRRKIDDWQKNEKDNGGKMW